MQEILGAMCTKVKWMCMNEEGFGAILNGEWDEDIFMLVISSSSGDCTADEWSSHVRTRKWSHN